MKTASRLIAFLAMTIAALAIMSSVALASTLVYSDEFNGALDTATWAKMTPWYTCYNSGFQAYYDPANCTVANGEMTIKTEKRAMNGYPYASGIVTSLNRPKFSYGYFEIRCQIPKGQAEWPAFWLTDDVTLELDVFEALGADPHSIYQTAHVQQRQVYQHTVNGPDYSAGYHTYAIDWQPTHVKWYIDGVETASYNAAIPSDPMWICIVNAVGGDWGGPATSATPNSVNFNIDYVRVYDTKPAGPVVTTPPTEPIVPVVTTPPTGSAGPVVNSPTVVTTPVVKVKSRPRRTYSVSGAVRVGTSAPKASAINPVPAAPVLYLQVQRLVNHRWSLYRTVGKPKPSSRYSAVLKMRTGRFRVRATVHGGNATYGRSAWSSSFRVQ